MVCHGGDEAQRLIWSSIHAEVPRLRSSVRPGVGAHGRSKIVSDTIVEYGIGLGRGAVPDAGQAGFEVDVLRLCMGAKSERYDHKHACYRGVSKKARATPVDHDRNVRRQIIIVFWRCSSGTTKSGAMVRREKPGLLKVNMSSMLTIACTLY